MSSVLTWLSCFWTGKKKLVRAAVLAGAYVSLAILIILCLPGIAHLFSELLALCVPADICDEAALADLRKKYGV
jgi:hypothetical protein